jgi:hypothetical protein
MKFNTALLLFAFITAIAAGQGRETIVEIKDERSKTNYSPDTTATDKKDGDIFIDRLLMRDSESHQNNNVYEVSFFKMHEGHLKYFDIGLVESMAYDRASYSWKNDTTVTMMLFSTQSNQFKIVSFVKEDGRMDLSGEVVK